MFIFGLPLEQLVLIAITGTTSDSLSTDSFVVSVRVDTLPVNVSGSGVF
jgi:hypothetical protein